LPQFAENIAPMNEIAGAPGAALDRQREASSHQALANPDARRGRARRHGGRVIAVAVLGAVVVAAGLAGTAGFVSFVGGIVAAHPPAAASAEGIVALTGGSARIDTALHLLAEGRARRLLISGVNPAVGSRAIAETVDPDLKSMIACCVDLGHEARDTIGNAIETRDWARQHQYGSLIVVTSAYHMPRSLAELANALPDVKLIAYPIPNPELRLADWWSEPSAFALLAREYGKYLLAAARLALGTPFPERDARAPQGEPNPVTTSPS
jgi:uncharacterized SAM-binding protein YcdF (DUF218 family)